MSAAGASSVPPVPPTRPSVSAAAAAARPSARAVRAASDRAGRLERRRAPLLGEAALAARIGAAERRPLVAGVVRRRAGRDEGQPIAVVMRVEQRRELRPARRRSRATRGRRRPAARRSRPRPAGSGSRSAMPSASARSKSIIQRMPSSIGRRIVDRRPAALRPSNRGRRQLGRDGASGRDRRPPLRRRTPWPSTGPAGAGPAACVVPSRRPAAPGKRGATGSGAGASTGCRGRAVGIHRLRRTCDPGGARRLEAIGQHLPGQRAGAARRRRRASAAPRSARPSARSSGVSAGSCASMCTLSG